MLIVMLQFPFALVQLTGQSCLCIVLLHIRNRLPSDVDATKGVKGSQLKKLCIVIRILRLGIPNCSRSTLSITDV